jgi:hypothetical protein
MIGSSWRAARALILSSGLLLIGCGPEAAVWLQVGAPLRIPTDVDELGMRARWGGASGAIAFERTYALSPELSFPLTLSLTSEQVGEDEVLWVEARGYKDGEQARPWSRSTGEVRLERGKMARLDLQMCDCRE